MKKLLLALWIAALSPLSAHYKDLYPHKPVKVLQSRTADRSTHYVEKMLTKFDVKIKDTYRVKPNDHSLYILDGNSIDLAQLPMHYIYVQTQDLKQEGLSDKQKEMMQKAVAVWDASWENINTYKQEVKNYYYLPEHYAFADPVILPCFLPTKALDGYKKMLIKSNSTLLDMSNHLPTLYVHAYLQQPENILELGVDEGQATEAFYEGTLLKGSKMFGVDPAAQWEKTYTKYADNRLRFFKTTSHKFPKQSMRSTGVKEFDIIFVDSSHLYEDTLKELNIYTPLVKKNGMLIFHDTYMSPEKGYAWTTLNNVVTGCGWDNKRGVIRALQEFFNIEFDEKRYHTTHFKYDDKMWKLIHYPFNNGLTIIKQVN